MKQNPQYQSMTRVFIKSFLLLAFVFCLSPIVEGSTERMLVPAGSAGSEHSERLHHQDDPVSGIVTDAEGQPFPGVTVTIKGTSTGIATDMEGRFVINTSNVEDPILVFSFIGYQSQEVAVNNQVFLEISLQEDTHSLQEVVVVGYGTQTKASLTGSVSQVTGDVLENRPITSIGSGLQGLMPGVTVRNPSALPGQGWGSIRIRGISTWGNAEPLVVVDGIPGGNLNILNPDDIESISVLKDAAAASIYGVRGSNGVIVVTTKQGTKDVKARITYSNYFGIQTPTALPEFANSIEYMELQNEAMRNVSLNPRFTQADIETARSGSNPNFFANTNWIDEIYRSQAPQQSHNVSISGGAENMDYYISYGFLKEGGLLTGDSFNANRHNVRMRLNARLSDRLDVSTNVGYVSRNHSGSSAGIGAGSGPLYSAHQMSPLVPVRFTTGGWGTSGSMPNPVAMASEGGTNAFDSQEFTANLTANLELFEGFNLRGQYGLIQSNSKRNIFWKTIDYNHPENGSLMYQTNFPNTVDARDYTSIYQTIIGIAEYTKKFAISHDVNAMLGVSQEKTIGENFSASRQGLPTQEVGYINLGTENIQNSGNASQNALQSLFGRINYSYKDKYLAEVNFRYDGSSRFAREVRWQMFSSASVGWVFSEENFFQPLNKIIEFGKIRVSYGTQGNDRVGSDFPYMSILNPVQNTAMMPIGNSPTVGFRHTVAANRLLTWESANKQNLGIDLSSLNGRIEVTAEYFINRTNDILLNPPLPAVYGYGTSHPPQNAGSIENKGWEMQLAWKDQIDDFRYGFNVNLSDVQNRVVSLGDVAATLGNQVRIEGHPLNAFYGLVADGLAQESDFSNDPETGNFIPNFPVIAGDPVRPGDIKYRDLNGGNEITLDDDRQVIGSDVPRYTYGFRGDVGWKGFDFSFFIQGVGKADGYIDGAARHAFANVSSPIPQKIHLDRWTPENPGASYPRLTHLLDHNIRMSTYWLEDASYLRLKNIQLGYTLSPHITQKIRVNRLRVYASADNIFTQTNFFYGYDPESPVSRGGFYPQVKTYVFGLNIEL